MYGDSLVCYLLFFLAAFNILSLCLIIVSLISMCLGVLPLGFILCGTLGTSWTWLTISFSFGETFNYNLLKKFPHTLSFSLLLLGPLQFNCWCIWYCPRGLWDYSQFFSFFLLLLFRSYFHHFICQFKDSFFCFRYSAIDSFQSIFNLSNCVVCLCVYIL